MYYNKITLSKQLKHEKRINSVKYFINSYASDTAKIIIIISIISLIAAIIL